MVEETEERPRQSGEQNPGVQEDVTGPDEPGRRSAETTPPIGDEAEQGRTTTPAEPEDVGVPPDEEMNEPDE